ncbi:hypothetical protein ACXYMU_04610 [Pontibacter sp. CAU 1760]
MKTLVITILGLFLCLYLAEVKAQDTRKTNTERQGTPAKFYLSLSGGIGLAGPKTEIENQMKASGFNDQSSNWFSGDEKQYPESYRLPIAKLGAAYFFQRGHGIKASAGLADHLEVRGYDDVGIGNYLTLRSALWELALNYVLRSTNERHYLSIGPALFLHAVEDKSASPAQGKNRNTKVGVAGGYTLHLINKRSWFLAYQANARWAPESEVGPFIAEHETGIVLPEPEVHSSEFRSVKVKLSGFDMGLAFGIKMR